MLRLLQKYVLFFRVIIFYHNVIQQFKNFNFRHKVDKKKQFISY